jgi:hypothetical protein
MTILNMKKIGVCLLAIATMTAADAMPSNKRALEMDELYSRDLSSGEGNWGGGGRGGGRGGGGWGWGEHEHIDEFHELDGEREL